MTIHDLSTVYTIGNEVFTRDQHVFLYRTWEAHEITGLFSSDPELCFVAEDDTGQVIGFVLGCILEKPRSSWTYAYLVWTAVTNEFQGARIGQHMYREMERRAKRMGARMMIIDTESSNTGAVSFFKKMGFTIKTRHIWMTKLLRKRKRTGS